MAHLPYYQDQGRRLIHAGRIIIQDYGWFDSKLYAVREVGAYGNYLFIEGEAQSKNECALHIETGRTLKMVYPFVCDILVSITHGAFTRDGCELTMEVRSQGAITDVKQLDPTDQIRAGMTLAQKQCQHNFTNYAAQRERACFLCHLSFADADLLGIRTQVIVMRTSAGPMTRGNIIAHLVRRGFSGESMDLLPDYRLVEIFNDGRGPGVSNDGQPGIATISWGGGGAGEEITRGGGGGASPVLPPGTTATPIQASPVQHVPGKRRIVGVTK